MEAAINAVVRRRARARTARLLKLREASSS